MFGKLPELVAQYSDTVIYILKYETLGPAFAAIKTNVLNLELL